MTLDKLTRMAIAEAVTKAVREANEVYDEQWVTKKQLCEQCGFFTEQWLKTYGPALERIGCKMEMKVIDAQGVEHGTHPCYAKKRLLRMIAEGEIFVMPQQNKEKYEMQTIQARGNVCAVS